MKAIRLEEPGRFTRISLEPVTAVLQPDEALVRVHRIGVCGTDIHAFRGDQPFFTYPRILGHELGVEVLELGGSAFASYGATGPAEGFGPGGYCAVEPYLNCGACIACRQGKPNCCVRLSVLGVHVDGGMRETLIVPIRKLHPSKNLTLDQLALVETLAIGCHAVDRAGLEKGEFVLVIGAGPIGLGVMQFAIEAGAQVIVLDINAQRLEFCRRRLNVPYVIDASRENVLAALAEITTGDLPTAVFDATGNGRSMASAFEYPANGGRLILVGLFQGEITFNDPNFHRRELTILASRNARPDDFTRIIALIEAKRIDTSPWITHRARLSDVVTEFALWTKAEIGVIKAMIEA
ncbi:MAG: zinc-binding alcohol dehydrogenase family protein [Verrucomicrobia bacterium]|nr:zinc-binding alcohol dehydrogenase family protein [Verrucomicrobiota bacterium]